MYVFKTIRKRYIYVIIIILSFTGLHVWFIAQAHIRWLRAVKQRSASFIDAWCVLAGGVDVEKEARSQNQAEEIFWLLKMNPDTSKLALKEGIDFLWTAASIWLLCALLLQIMTIS